MAGAQSVGNQLKVFISYSRSNAGAADAMVAALSARGFEVKIDTRDLPFGEVWQRELAEFIRLSDTVIWLVSEASIISKWVNWELDEVARRNKRLVPVMIADTDRGALPRQLGEIHILPAHGIFDLSRDLDILVRVLEADHAWLKQASRLQDRATEWRSNGRTSSLLLSRGALIDAERWKDKRPAKAPAPAQEVLDLLHVSRQAATRRQRWWVGGATAVAAASLALTVFAFLQMHAAEKSLRASQIAESRFRAEQAYLAVGQGDNVTAMLLALEGLPDKTSRDDYQRTRPAIREVALALVHAWSSSREKLILSGHVGEIRSANFFTNDKFVLTSSADATVRLWDRDSGKVTLTISTQEPSDAAYSPNGRFILTATKAKTVSLWDVATGQLVKIIPGQLIGELVSGSGLLLMANHNQTLVVEKDTGLPVGSLPIDSERIRVAQFSPNDKFALTVAHGNDVQLWEVASKKAWTAPIPKERQVDNVSFSPDSKHVLIEYSNSLPELWSTDNDRRLSALADQQTIPIVVVFSPDSKLIATLSRVSDLGRGFGASGSTRVSDPISGKVISIFNSGSGSFLPVSFSPDSRFLLTQDFHADYEIQRRNVLRLWEVSTGVQAGIFSGHQETVSTAAFSPDGGLIITTSNSDSAPRIWETFPPDRLTRLVDKDNSLEVKGTIGDVVLGSNDRLEIRVVPDGTKGFASVQMTIQSFVDLAWNSVPRCLTPEQRVGLFLHRDPPAWCMALAKWPYDDALPPRR